MRPNFDLKEEVRAFWSARSAGFDDDPAHRIEARYGLPVWQAFLRKAMGLAQEEDALGCQVLDLACGTGEISRVLCSLGAAVTGVDFSEEMLARAQAKLARTSWTPHLGDAERLVALPDVHFDFVVTRHLAWTLTDPDAAYREWLRVLRPGGRLLINDGNWAQRASPRDRLRRAIAQWIDPVPVTSHAVTSAHAAIFARLPYRDGLTASRLAQALRNAGFERITALNPGPLYAEGMRGHSLATRLRQTSENRFALLARRPG